MMTKNLRCHKDKRACDREIQQEGKYIRILSEV